eukprot:GHVU01098823.1.p1 GENE.GHVU01098823.1~~GHVU01098823.1.p1  ORF type:complete len:355 (+),score=22.32 GHVU01098823.1:59-1123(+)
MSAIESIGRLPTRKEPATVQPVILFSILCVTLSNLAGIVFPGQEALLRMVFSIIPYVCAWVSTYYYSTWEDMRFVAFSLTRWWRSLRGLAFWDIVLCFFLPLISVSTGCLFSVFYYSLDVPIPFKMTRSFVDIPRALATKPDIWLVGPPMELGYRAYLYQNLLYNKYTPVKAAAITFTVSALSSLPLFRCELIYSASEPAAAAPLMVAAVLLRFFLLNCALCCAWHKTFETIPFVWGLSAMWSAAEAFPITFMERNHIDYSLWALLVQKCLSVSIVGLMSLWLLANPDLLVDEMTLLKRRLRDYPADQRTPRRDLLSHQRPIRRVDKTRDEIESEVESRRLERDSSLRRRVAAE